MMKTVVVFLTVLACAFGLQEQDSGNDSLVEVDYCKGPGNACITPPCITGGTSSSCIGSATIISVDDGNQVEHVKFIQDEKERLPAKVCGLKYKSKLSRQMTKIVQTQGNCCWEFYRR